MPAGQIQDSGSGELSFSENPLFFLFLKIYFIFIYVCVCTSACEYGYPQKPERGRLAPGAGTIGGCEHPMELSSGVLWKSSKSSRPIISSGPGGSISIFMSSS